MGGASSILEGARVYVSHSKDLDTKRLEDLITRIERMNVQVSTFDKYNPDEFKTQIEQCQLMVVCIGADILRSYQQIRDYNEATTHNKKMVYLLMDEKYTPRHPIRKDSDTWKLLHEQNRFDVHLYEYSKELFQSQSFIFGL